MCPMLRGSWFCIVSWLACLCAAGHLICPVAGLRPRRGIQTDANTTHPRTHTHQQEPAHCGMVLVSRRAGRPDSGSVVLTQLSMTASGLSGVPEGRKLSVSGSTSGREDSGSATGWSEPSGNTRGNGSPQYLHHRTRAGGSAPHAQHRRRGVEFGGTGVGEGSPQWSCEGARRTQNKRRRGACTADGERRSLRPRFWGGTARRGAVGGPQRVLHARVRQRTSGGQRASRAACS